jgi:hypothetical protein
VTKLIGAFRNYATAPKTTLQFFAADCLFSCLAVDQADLRTLAWLHCLGCNLPANKKGVLEENGNAYIRTVAIT